MVHPQVVLNPVYGNCYNFYLVDPNIGIFSPNNLVLLQNWLKQTLVTFFPLKVVSLLKPGQSSMSGASYGLSLDLNIEQSDYLRGGQVRKN